MGFVFDFILIPSSGKTKQRYWNFCVTHGLMIEELSGQYG